MKKSGSELNKLANGKDILVDGTVYSAGDVLFDSDTVYDVEVEKVQDQDIFSPEYLETFTAYVVRGEGIKRFAKFVK